MSLPTRIGESSSAHTKQRKQHVPAVPFTIDEFHGSRHSVISQSGEPVSGMHCLPRPDSRLKRQQCFLQVNGVYDERQVFGIAPAESAEDYSDELSHRVHGVDCD
jgi:hypothetical protein